MSTGQRFGMWLATLTCASAFGYAPSFVSACPAPHQWLTLRGWSRDGQAFLSHGDSTERGAFIEARDERGELLLDMDTPHSELTAWDRKLRINGRMAKGTASPDGRWNLTHRGTQLLVLRLHDRHTGSSHVVDVLWDATEETRYRLQVQEVVWRDDSAAFAVRTRSLGPPDEPCYDDEDQMPDGDASYDRVVNATPSAVVERARWIRAFFQSDPSFSKPLPDTLDPMLMLAVAVELLGPEAPRALGRAMSDEKSPWHLHTFDPVYLQALLPVVRIELRGMAPPAGLRAFLEQDSPGRAVVFTRGEPDDPEPDQIRVLHSPTGQKFARRVATWIGRRDADSPTPPAPIALLRRLELEEYRVGDELVPAAVLTGPVTPLQIDWSEVGDNVRRVTEVLAAIAVREQQRPSAPPGRREALPPTPRPQREPEGPPKPASSSADQPPQPPVTAAP